MNLRKILSVFNLSTILFILMNFGIARSSFAVNVKSKIDTHNIAQIKIDSADRKIIQPVVDKSVSPWAIAGFVCNIIGLAMVLSLTMFFFGGILGILGTIFSAIGLKHANKGRGGKGLSIAGLAAGIIAMLLTSIIIWYFIAFF